MQQTAQLVCKIVEQEPKHLIYVSLKKKFMYIEKNHQHGLTNIDNQHALDSNKDLKHHSESNQTCVKLYYCER